MHGLTHLNMERNELEASDAKEWRFLDSLTNCTRLQVLGLDDNNLRGRLPKSFGNLSIELQQITLGFNYISGCIPNELGRYANLFGLGLEANLLEGPIPKCIGKLQSLQLLTLKWNNLTDIIPYSLGNLTKLNQLMLGFNRLSGPIPSSLQNIQSLCVLGLSHNNLTGIIPGELFFMRSLSYILDLSFNSLTGTIPSEVGQLENLIIIDFSNNKLTGKLPEALENCQILSELYMTYNFFNGSIPTSLGHMKNLEIIDLSHNNLSGVIPTSLQSITPLKHLNLSFNELEGEVPYEGVFANCSAISLVGNEKLCGGIPKLHLPKCVSGSSPTKRINHNLIKILVAIPSMLIILLALLLCYTLLYKKQKLGSKRRKLLDASLSTLFSRISYAKLAKATNGFSTSHIVGYGRYGSVYKAILRDYQVVVAIKVFKLEVYGAVKSFTNECDALRSIRHRNLVRVLTSCSTIDHQGRDFKALIFEFMPKGNLDIWLHQEYENNENIILSLEKRLSIAMDVANALEYLHYSCEPSIIHCDIKPSNILLDNDMIAHVGDFGLSRILYQSMSMSLQDCSDKNEVKGTIGYVAQEYGEGARPTTSSDVYSFGIILLEMLTGRRPTDHVFKDNLNLYNYVRMVFPHTINNIIDLKMFTEEERQANRWSCQNINNCLLSLAEVGLSCSTTLP